MYYKLIAIFSTFMNKFYYIFINIFQVTFDAMDTNNGNAVVTKTLCLTQVTNVNKIHYKEQMPQLLDCDKTTKFQKWRWTYKFDYSYDWEGPNAKKLTNS